MAIKNLQDLVNAQTEISRAVWAGNLTTAYDSSFDDLDQRDKYVLNCVNNAIKPLEDYQKKLIKPSPKKRLKGSGGRKTIFD